MPTIDLKPFCAPDDDHREPLKAPMLTQHGLVATNGEILICVPGTEGPLCVVDYINSFLDKFAPLLPSTTPLFGLAVPPDRPCGVCQGQGYRFQSTCEECQGTGRFHHGTHWYGCKSCNTLGSQFSLTESICSSKRPCLKCNGLGSDDRSHSEVGANHFLNRYLRLLKTLPNVYLQTAKGPAKFLFDGGWGVLMPYRT